MHLEYARNIPPKHRLGAFVADTENLGWAFALLHDFPKADVLLTGGTVRDAILGRLPHGLHTLVRDVAPPKLTHWLENHGAVHKTQEGVWRFTPEGKLEPVDVTVPRERRLNDDGHVHFVPHAQATLADDLHGRDFTMNAMAYSMRDGELHDPYAGFQDLSALRLRTVRNPFTHFMQEPHAITRALRLAGQMGANIEDQTWHAMHQLGHHLHRTHHDHDGRAVYSTPRHHLGRDFLVGLVHGPGYFLTLLRQSGSHKHLAPELESLDKLTYHDGESGSTKTHHLLSILSQPSHLRTYGILIPSATLLVAGLFVLLEELALPNLRSFVTRLHLHASDDPRAPFNPYDAAWLLEKAHTIREHDPSTLSPAQLERLLGSSRGNELLALVHAKLLTEGPHSGSGDALYILRHLKQQLDARMQAPKLIRGRDLVALGLSPGPHLRSIIDKIRDAQLSGNLASRAAALDFARYLMYDNKV